MMNREEIVEAVMSRLSNEPPYSFFVESRRAYYASRMANCDEKLLPNLLQWLQNEPLTDIWIGEKYCIGAVMKIRESDDFVQSFIALDDYARDTDFEYAIWQRWA